MDNIPQVGKYSIDDLNDAELTADPIDFECQLVVMATFNDEHRPSILSTVKPSDFKNIINQEIISNLIEWYNDGTEFSTEIKYLLLNKYNSHYKQMLDNQASFIDLRPEFCIDYVLRTNYQNTLLQQINAFTENCHMMTPLDDCYGFVEQMKSGLDKHFDERIMRNELDNKKQLIDDALVYIQQCQKGEIKCISWGLDGLDKKMLLRKNGCFFVGAQTGVGKTAFAVSCILNQLKSGHAVALWCGEMTQQQIIMRFLSQMADVDLSRFEQQGTLSASELQAIAQAVAELKSYKLYLLCGADLEMHQIVKWVRSLYKIYNIECVWLDYFTDIQPTVKTGNEKRFELMGEVARKLKSLKKELPIPVITLAQLNRDAVDRRPRKTDLAESSITERVADGIILIERHDDWTEVSDRGYKWPGSGVKIDHSHLEGKAVLIVDKNRHGPRGISIHKFYGSTMRYGEMVDCHIDRETAAFPTGG